MRVVENKHVNNLLIKIFRRAINESPLEVKKDTEVFKHTDKDAILFYQIGNRVILLDSKNLSKDFDTKVDKDNNKDILRKLKKNKDFDEDREMVLSVFSKAYEEKIITKKDFENLTFKKLYKKYVKLSGRLWTKGKIISLWNYPETYSDFENFISNLNNKLTKNKKKTIDSNWDIEIPVKKGWANKAENIQYMINTGKHEFDAIISFDLLSGLYDDILFNDKTFSEEMLIGFGKFSKVALPIIAGISVGKIGAYLASIAIKNI